jgi:hypothetical protein
MSVGIVHAVILSKVIYKKRQAYSSMLSSKYMNVYSTTTAFTICPSAQQLSRGCPGRCKLSMQ